MPEMFRLKTWWGPKRERAGKKRRWWAIVDDKLPPKRYANPRYPGTHALSLEGPVKVGLGEISQIFVTFKLSKFRRTSTHLGCHEGKRKKQRLTAGSSAESGGLRCR